MLIISVDVRNRLTDDLIVIPIFSVGSLGPTRVAIASGEGGLTRDSALFCEEVCTIDRDFLASGPLGPIVSANLLDEVVAAIRNAIEP